jgi:hypothetical protein
VVRAKKFILGLQESAGLNKLFLEFGVKDEYGKVWYTTIRHVGMFLA